jgi:3-oxoacyl-[acyl-carrier-protein] synthase-3
MSAIPGVAIRAVAAAVPTLTARTQDYEFLTPDERQRFQKVTGIAERRIVRDGQFASDLCAAAAERVVGQLGWEKDSIGALILVTQSPDQPIPATAITLQHKFGLPQNCVAFDVNLGCSAYPYGLAIASSMMRSLSIRRCLLLVGDISSRSCAVHDKSAWPLFGDAGSATALELDESAPDVFYDLMSDGSGKDAIVVPSGTLSSRRPPGDGPVQQEIGSDGILRRIDNLVLRGADIFSFAISKVPPSILRAMEASARQPQQIDYLVLHQANKMINDTIAKKTGFTPAQSLSTLAAFGNTSSASIPVTLCAHAEHFDEPRQLALCGFGVGLSWGSCIVSLPAGAVLPLIETDNVY